MDMQKNKFVILPSALIAAFGFILSINRAPLFGASKLTDMLIGAAPSFLCVLGLSLIASFLAQTPNLKKFLPLSCGVAFGVLIIEILQYWGPQVFDPLDVFACLLAVPCAYFMFKYLNREAN